VHANQFGIRQQLLVVAIGLRDELRGRKAVRFVLADAGHRRHVHKAQPPQILHVGLAHEAAADYSNLEFLHKVQFLASR